MNQNETNKWKEALFAGEDWDSLQEASLRKGLTQIRRQRREQILFRTSAVVMFFILGAVALLTPHPQLKTAQTITKSPPASGIALISEDDLVKLFPNRPLAIVGSGSHRKLVFLDQPPDSSQQ